MENKPFALIGVNSDKKERVLDAMERENITWRSFWNGGSTGGPISRAWGIRGWPTIYILDDRGVIRFKNARGEAMNKAVDELIEEAIGRLVENIKSDDPNLRGLAAFRMAKYNLAGAVAEITPLLKDSSPFVAQRAAAGLALLGQPLQPLLPQVRLAASDRDPEMRIAALLTLGTAKDKQTIDLAMKAMEDKIVEVRRAAVTALGKLDDPEATPVLAKAVDDEDAQIVRNAVYALADLNAPASTKVIKQLAAKKDHPARVWVAVAMHRLGEGNTLETFQTLLKDDEVKTRRQAASALVELEDFDALDLMIKALEDTDAKISKTAQQFLAKNDSPRAQEALHDFLVSRIDKLIAMFGKRDYQTQREARKQLGDLGPEAAPILLKKLDEGLPTATGLALAAAIGSSGNMDLIDPVVKKLRIVDLDKGTRTNYEWVLMYFRDKAREPATELLKSSDSVVRLSAVHVLATLRDEETVKVLSPLLKSDDVPIRNAVALALGAQHVPDALPVLKELVQQSGIDAQSLQRAAYALAGYGDQSLPFLAKVLSSDNRSIRLTVISALGQNRSKRATEVIAKAVNDDATLTTAAGYAFYRQGTKAAAETLGGFLKTADSNAQQRIIAYLSRMRVPAARKIVLQFKEEQRKKAEEARKKDAKKSE